MFLTILRLSIMSQTNLIFFPFTYIIVFKDPTGKFVFNSRKLVVEHLRTTNFDLSDDDLVTIMEESDSESDLSDTESENSDTEDDDEDDIIRRKKENIYQIPSNYIKKEIKLESEFLLADNQTNDFMSF